MSIFSDTITALSGTVPPLHQAVSNAHQAMKSATTHLSDALDHLGRDFQQALSDKAAAEAALADAQRRVDELRAVALHIASVGDGVDKLIGMGQQIAAQPSAEAAVEQAVSDIPQAIEEVKQVVNDAEQVVADTQTAVATGAEPATNV